MPELPFEGYIPDANRAVTALAWSPNDEYLAYAQADFYVSTDERPINIQLTVVRVATQQVVFNIRFDHDAEEFFSIGWLIWSPDGSRLYIATELGHFQCLSVPDFQVVFHQSMGFRVFDRFSLAPDSKHFVSVAMHYNFAVSPIAVSYSLSVFLADTATEIATVALDIPQNVHGILFLIPWSMDGSRLGVTFGPYVWIYQWRAGQLKLEHPLTFAGSEVMRPIWIDNTHELMIPLHNDEGEGTVILDVRTGTIVRQDPYIPYRLYRASYADDIMRTNDHSYDYLAIRKADTEYIVAVYRNRITFRESRIDIAQWNHKRDKLALGFYYDWNYADDYPAPMIYIRDNIPQTPIAGSTLVLQTMPDDVNRNDAAVSDVVTSIWQYTPYAGNASHISFRFRDVQLPPNVWIESAKLELFSTQNVLQPDLHKLSVESGYDIDSADPEDSIYAKTHTHMTISCRQATSWPTNKWYEVTDVRFFVQEVVARPNWNAGQAFTLIMTQADEHALTVYQSDPHLAARLTVTYYPVSPLRNPE
jgi:hypothetical protein